MRPPSTPSDTLNVEARVEAPKIVGVARHDYGAFAPRDESDGSLDDVGRSRAPAQHASGFGEDTIERRDLGRSPVEQRAENGLAARVANDLPHHAGRHHEPRARPKRLTAEGSQTCIPSLERDERTGV